MAHITTAPMMAIGWAISFSHQATKYQSNDNPCNQSRLNHRKIVVDGVPLAPVAADLPNVLAHHDGRARRPDARRQQVARQSRDGDVNCMFRPEFPEVFSKRHLGSCPSP